MVRVLGSGFVLKLFLYAIHRKQSSTKINSFHLRRHTNNARWGIIIFSIFSLFAGSSAAPVCSRSNGLHPNLPPDIGLALDLMPGKINYFFITHKIQTVLIPWDGWNSFHLIFSPIPAVWIISRDEEFEVSILYNIW